MLKAEQFAIALIVCQENEWYVTGSTADIGRLNSAGFVAKAWDIRLDNGHRPFAWPLKRVTYDIDGKQANETPNVLTTMIANTTGIVFTQNLHHVEHTYLLRATPEFWSDLYISFADEDGRLRDIIPTDYHAIYRGRITHDTGNVKFVRLEPDTLV